MSSSAQVIGHGTGHAAPSAHRHVRPDETDAAAKSGTAAHAAHGLPTGRDAPRSPANVVRLPGQEVAGEPGPRRPLISGGAFTLAVAIGLSLDQSSRPASLEPATPSSIAAGAGAESAETEPP